MALLQQNTFNKSKTGAPENPNNRKNIINKSWVPFTNCISEINNTQIDNAKDTDIVMQM